MEHNRTTLLLCQSKSFFQPMHICDVRHFLNRIPGSIVPPWYAESLRYTVLLVEIWIVMMASYYLVTFANCDTHKTSCRVVNNGMVGDCMAVDGVGDGNLLWKMLATRMRMTTTEPVEWDARASSAASKIAGFDSMPHSPHNMSRCYFHLSIQCQLNLVIRM